MPISPTDISNSVGLINATAEGLSISSENVCFFVIDSSLPGVIASRHGVWEQSSERWDGAGIWKTGFRISTDGSLRSASLCGTLVSCGSVFGAPGGQSRRVALRMPDEDTRPIIEKRKEINEIR